MMAKVVGGRDNATTEDVVPDSVDCNPRSQRVIGPEEIACEFLPSVRLPWIRCCINDFEKSAWHSFEWSLVVAAFEEFLVADIAWKNPRRADRDWNTGFDFTVADDEQAQTTTTTTVTVAQRFTQAQVTSARVLDFPFTTESGASWDATNGPDVYLVAMDASGSTVSTSPPLADVEPADLPFPLVFTPFTIADTSERYVLAIYDADTGSADDFIGGIEFDLSARVGVYPETITLDAGAGVVLEVTLDWAP